MQHGDKQEPTFGLDIQALTDIIACGDAGRRTDLALQIADFLADPETPAGEREQIVPVARSLAADEDIAVRHAFAEALADLETLDADLLFTIAADDDDIALPFLGRTPALDPLRMLAVLRAGGEARQAVIATRPDLSPDAIDFITRDLSLAVNALLLENGSVKLRPVHCRAIYKRFGAESEMLERLLARPELPPVIRIVQARRSAANLRAMLADRRWLPSLQAADLVAAAEETAMLEVLAMAEDFDLPAAVAFLIDKDMLTPSLILHAACLGEMHVVAECLAGLSGLSRRRVEEQMYGRGKFRALHGRCGLPQSCYWTLQAACDAAAEESEAGLQLSADEFGASIIEQLLTRYEALSPAEQPRHLDLVRRYAAGNTRHLAARLRAGLQQAA